MPEPSTRSSIAWCLLIAALLTCTNLLAVTYDPDASEYTGRTGKTIYVSKLGDNTDGSSWGKAFHTIQAAVGAVPDDQGGHRVIIRPDTYPEANIFPSFKGAKGSYNLLVGDFDGSLGSGAKGWVVVDAGAPLVTVRHGDGRSFKILENGDPQKETGFKSVDWWGPWRCDMHYSGNGWDRWIYRHIYATGAEGGIGWDITIAAGAEHSNIIEDCVGLGRFTGAGVIGHVPRPGEPVVFRRSYFLNMDIWGDAGGVYVRGASSTMPELPHALFEDCTIVGTDNALNAAWPGVDDVYTRVKFKGCNLIVLNFSQPRGTPSSGIIYSGARDGKQLHVDFEDCTLMGFKVFGGRGGPISYSTRGRVRAYVQYEQSVPPDMERLRFWPVDAFRDLIPPRFPASKHVKHTDIAGPVLTKLPFAFGPAMENTPVIFRGRPIIAMNHRDDSGGPGRYTEKMYLYIKDLDTGLEISRFATGFSFASAYVTRDAEGEELHVFGSQGTDTDWFHDLYHFRTRDLETWEKELAIPRAGSEHLFNCSVTRDEEGYLMAYESNEPVKFCFKFARSKDLSSWEKIPDLVFRGLGNEYSACPVIRYIAPYYYVIYLHMPIPGHKGLVSFMARSRDLETFQLSPLNPVLEASEGEGVNNSDVDLFEFEGKTYLFYATGDQQSWGTVKVAMFDGDLRSFFESYYPEGLPTVTVSTRPPIPDYHRNETRENKDKRVQWWRDARFGMFIHWGLYAVPAGEHKGIRSERISSYIQDWANIPRAEYAQFAKNFNPVDFDAAAWAQLAQDAGMKYLVITAKHHEGFCIYDSDFTNFDIMDATPYGKDVLADLSRECRKRNIHFGVYYSIPDWHDESQYTKIEGKDPTSGTFKNHIVAARKPGYLKYMKSQLRELVQKYDAEILWFDGEWVDWWSSEEGKDLYNYVRSLKPEILINNRADKERQVPPSPTDDEYTYAGDFGTPEQEIPATGLPGKDWETCMTMNNTWGYKFYDESWKSTRVLLRNLIDIVSKGGNYLLNVGPMANGRIPDASVTRLEEMGAWLRVNGEAIYGTRASPFALEWGRATQKGNKLYLHIFDWPDTPDRRIELPPLVNTVTGATLLGNESLRVTVTQSAERISVSLPPQAPHPIATVAVLELDGPPRVSTSR